MPAYKSDLVDSYSQIAIIKLKLVFFNYRKANSLAFDRRIVWHEMAIKLKLIFN